MREREKVGVHDHVHLRQQEGGSDSYKFKAEPE